jgi:lysophospholipase L1-like esterase
MPSPRAASAASENSTRPLTPPGSSSGEARRLGGDNGSAGTSPPSRGDSAGASLTPSRSAAATWIARTAYAAAILWAAGWLLHTSFNPVVLGKYNLRYTIFLGGIFLVVLPLMCLFVWFMTSISELRGSRGRRIFIMPRHKLIAFVAFSLVGYIVAGQLLRYFVAGTVATHDAHVFHPYLQNVATPGHVGQHVNRWGFKGDEIELTKGERTFRVFVFGGSTVHCGTVPYEQTHCRVLERRLQAAYPEYKIEVQNLGCEWHATEHDVIKLLFTAQDFSPDLVIMYHGINDVVRSFVPDLFGVGEYRSDYRHYLGPVTNLVYPNRALMTAINLFGGHWCSDFRFDPVRLEGPEGKGLHNSIILFFPKSQPVEIENWAALPAFERNTRDFVAIARSKQMNTLLATQPSLYREDLTPHDQELLSFPASHQFHGQRASLRSMVRGMKTFNDKARQIAQETDVRLVDLEALMPKTTEYMYDDVHYTKAGNELIGNAFADDIIKWELVPRTIQARATIAAAPATGD